MSEFNFDEPEDGTNSTSFSMPDLEIWDILSIVMILITACIGLYFVLIYINPNSNLNPLKPYQIQLPTPTITAIQLDATWTPMPTASLLPNVTLLPTTTAPATNTLANFVGPSETPKPTNTETATPTPKTPFSASSVNAIESIIIPHLLDAGCNWQGVGGTVDDQDSSPIIGIVVRLGGVYDGKAVELTTVSGVSPEYGKSGFEFVLGDTPVDSGDKLYVQLLDQAGLPLSNKIYIHTSSDCRKNLVLVRFKKNRK